MYIIVFILFGYVFGYNQIKFTLPIEDRCPVGELNKIQKNDNWRQVDQTSTMRLRYGHVLSRENTYFGTFRNDKGMGNDIESCQFWMPDRTLDYIDPGFNPYLVGVGSDLFNNSKACGQCLLIKNPKTGHSIVSVIADYIPEARSRNHLDIQSAGSAFLASGNSRNSKPYHGGPENYDGLQVWLVECSWQHPLQYYFTRGSDRFNWYVVIMFNSAPFDHISLFDSYNKPINVRISHDNYGRWTFAFHDGAGVHGKYKIHMSRPGKTVIDTITYTSCEKCLIVGRERDSVEHDQEIRGWPI